VHRPGTWVPIIKFNYSVLGDSVNSRPRGHGRARSNKEIRLPDHRRLQDRAPRVKDKFGDPSELDFIMVKGKGTSPEVIYAIAGREDTAQVSGKIPAALRKPGPSRWLACYRNRDWGRCDGREIERGPQDGRSAMPLRRLYDLYEARESSDYQKEPAAGRLERPAYASC